MTSWPELAIEIWRAQIERHRTRWGELERFVVFSI